MNAPAGALVAAPILLLIVFVAFGIGASFFTRLIGVAYPTFKSIIALESPSVDDDKQWLTYWCIFGIFSVLDEFGAFILSYIPYYYFIKVCLLIWLFNPLTQGATVIYSKAVKPVMVKYDKQIKELSGLLCSLVSSSDAPKTD